MRTIKSIVTASAIVMAVGLAGSSLAAYKNVLPSGDCSKPGASCKNTLLNKIEKYCGPQGSSKYKHFIKSAKKSGAIFYQTESGQYVIKKGSINAKKVTCLLKKKCGMKQ